MRLSSSTAPGRLVVLADGSPCTVGLVEAIASSRLRYSPQELVLYGRSQARLAMVRTYAHSRLTPFGWSVVATTGIRRALIGATFVLHQIRYGGHGWRDEDERLASSCGAPIDETLGPGALQSAVCSAPCIVRLARNLRELCPNAWVLNLTNPLSVTTAILARHGIDKCVGVCELLQSTV